MALKFDDLVFDQASCCGSHAVARHVDNAGYEWYFRRNGDVFCAMKMTGGMLDGAVRNGLTQQDVETVLKKMV